MKPRVLIVGTVPYNERSTSRAFESYFHGWDRDCLAQVFSNTKKPAKGHCGTLFQITDQRLLKRRFDSSIDVGRTYRFDELPDSWTDSMPEVEGSNFFARLYQLGSKKTPLVYLLRKLLWRKKYWRTRKFDEWLDRFSPECVFLSFSDDFFIPEIALYVARRFNIPIISSIGDDYYFNDRPSLSPLYYLYKNAYRRLIREVFGHGGSAIYISDKIRDKYNCEFNLAGETVYLTSKVSRRDFKPINSHAPCICYFGNIRQGRNESLNEVAAALGNLSTDFVLDVYSNQDSKQTLSAFEGNQNLRFNGSIPYSEVVEKMKNCDVLIHVEGFKEEHVKNTRYSLSTKIADLLSGGIQIFVYGSSECGALEYMGATGAAMVCTNREDLCACLSRLINDVDLQRRYYNRAMEVARENHSLDASTRVFENVVRRAINDWKSR